MKKVGIILLALVLVVAGLVLFNWPNLTDRAEKALYPRRYSQFVEREAKAFDLEENLVYAVIRTESGFDENARSNAGARGLMQLTQDTYDWVKSLSPEESPGDITDPADNIHCGCALIRLLLDQYGDRDTALCAYNAGMGSVSAWLADSACSSDGRTLYAIPYPETEAYLKKVKATWEKYDEIYGKR